MRRRNFGDVRGIWTLSTGLCHGIPVISNV